MKDLNELLDDFTWENFQSISSALTKVDKNNLEMEMRNLPTHYSYYHALLARAKTYLDSEHQTLAHMAADLSRNCQDAFATKGKKATAKDMENYVHTDEHYLKQLSNITKSQERYMMLKGLAQALEMKKDMLVQLNANNRAETKLYS
jgi:hypothetical protein